MRVLAAELRSIRLPFAAPHRTAFGVQTERHIAMLHLHTSDGPGWGEALALAQPTYSDEYVDGVLLVVERHLLPLLFGSENLDGDSLDQLVSIVKGHRMAKAMVEMAVLDVELRRSDQSLARHLGAVSERVPCGASIGILDDLDQLQTAVADRLGEGYQRIKLNITAGWDLDPVRTVRDAFGPLVALQVDANGTYDASDIGRLCELDRFELLLIEQPFSPDDLPAHVALGRRIETPICLDESITSLTAARSAIESGAARVVNIKPGRIGGVKPARQVHDLCRSHGVAWFVGGMYESALGKAANLAVAALDGSTLPHDLVPTSRYFSTDVANPVVMASDGYIAVPSSPGIGCEPVKELVDHLTINYSLVRGRRVSR